MSILNSTAPDKNMTGLKNNALSTGTDKDDHGEIVNAATIEDLCYAHGIAYNWSGEIHNKKIAYIPVDTQ